MQLFLQRVDHNLLWEAQQYFSPDFLSHLSAPYLAQKKIKNLLLQQARSLSESDLLYANQHHAFGEKFFSAAYTRDRFFLALADQKVGVDLEYLRPRDEVLLEKFAADLQMIGQTDWLWFYLLWTAREAILKASDTFDLDAMEKIQLLSITPSSSSRAGLSFEWSLVFEYLQHHWTVLVHQEATIVCSLCLG